MICELGKPTTAFRVLQLVMIQQLRTCDLRSNTELILDCSEVLSQWKWTTDRIGPIQTCQEGHTTEADVLASAVLNAQLFSSLSVCIP